MASGNQDGSRHAMLRPLTELFSGWQSWASPALLILFLLCISRYNFLLFHTLVELFAISVAIILSVVVWQTYSFSRNHFLMYLGCGYFWIGALDLLHTLSFKGMHIFPNLTPNTSTQVWIATRYLETLLLISALYFLRHSVNRTLALSFFGTGAMAVTVWILSGTFPDAYIEGNGLTDFKVASEYIIIAVLFVAIGLLYRNRDLLDRRIVILMYLSLALTAAAELTFTLYINVFSWALITGHIFKLLSYWFVFVAVVRTTLTDPYQVMARGSSTYDAVPDPTIVVDRKGIVRQANKAANKLAGNAGADMLGVHCHDIFHPGEISRKECLVCRYIENGMELHAHQMFFSGTDSWREFTLTPINVANEPSGMVHVSPDITARKHAEDELRMQANYDSLTGFPNRVLGIDRLEQAIKLAHRHGCHTALMFIDLDNFKNINDTLGHAIGDKLLVEVARRLESSIRDSDTIARWGGDEFLVVTPELSELRDAEYIAEKILDSLTDPVEIEGREFRITVSLGISGCPEDADKADILLSHADAAMYAAKGAGKNTYRFFTEDLNRFAAEYMQIELHLGHAVRKRELAVHYQPQIDINTGRVVGAEALLRWESEALGNVSPSQFIPIAESGGHIIPIGTWTLRRICEDIRDWKDSGRDPCKVAVNISSRQVRNRDFVDVLSRILHDTGANPEDIEVEITESLLLDDNPETIDQIKQLKALGVGLSLDDFGTGYSSLSYLKKFPFDKLKIDRAFIRDITVDPGDAALCSAIIAMADNLGLSVVGEGVETREQLQFLKEQGAAIAQGYLFSQPLPVDAFIDYCEQHFASAG